MSLYRPVLMIPNNTDIDALLDNDFTLQINGTMCVGYKIIIYKNSDNSVVYNSADQTLVDTLYNGDTLTITVPSTSGMINGTDYKWTVDLYETVVGTDPIVSNEIFFKARTTPVVTISNFIDPVTIRNYIFEGSYTQAESVAIKYYQFLLYNNSTGDLLEDTGKVFSANIEFDYDSYLDGVNYDINLIVENQDGTLIETGLQNFDTTYSVPTISFGVIAENNAGENAVNISWDNAVQIPGTNSGSSVSYLSDTPFAGTTSVVIPDASLVIYDSVNGNEMSFSSVVTVFIHNNFDKDELNNNTISGTGWSINGVISTIDLEGDTTSYKKILTFEDDQFFNVYTQFDATSEPILQQQYNIYTGLNEWLLAPTQDVNTNYTYQDSELWNDSYIWVESAEISTIWWKLAWIHDSASTSYLVWQRNSTL